MWCVVLQGPLFITSSPAGHPGLSNSIAAEFQKAAFPEVEPCCASTYLVASCLLISHKEVTRPNPESMRERTSKGYDSWAVWFGGECVHQYLTQSINSRDCIFFFNVHIYQHTLEYIGRRSINTC